jgi:hypothetical protein
MGVPVALPVAPRVTAAPPRLLNGFSRLCPACGKPFHALNAKRLTCSNACRQDRYRQRLRARAGDQWSGDR